MFQSIEHFISAVEECVYRNDETRSLAPTWKNRFIESYRSEKGITLAIPRWYEIEESYNYKRIRQLEKAQSDVNKTEAALEVAQAKLVRKKGEMALSLENGMMARLEGVEEDIRKYEEKVSMLVEKLAKQRKKLDLLQ